MKLISLCLLIILVSNSLSAQSGYFQNGQSGIWFQAGGFNASTVSGSVSSGGYSYKGILGVYGDFSTQTYDMAQSGILTSRSFGWGLEFLPIKEEPTGLPFSVFLSANLTHTPGSYLKNVPNTFTSTHIDQVAHEYSAGISTSFNNSPRLRLIPSLSVLYATYSLQNTDINTEISSKSEVEEIAALPFLYSISGNMEIGLVPTVRCYNDITLYQLTLGFYSGIK